MSDYSCLQIEDLLPSLDHRFGARGFTGGRRAVQPLSETAHIRCGLTTWSFLCLPEAVLVEIQRDERLVDVVVCVELVASDEARIESEADQIRTGAQKQ